MTRESKFIEALLYADGYSSLCKTISLGKIRVGISFLQIFKVSKSNILKNGS